MTLQTTHSAALLNFFSRLTVPRSQAVLLRDQLLVNGFPQTALLRIYEQAHCVEVEDSNGLPLPPPPLMRQPAAGFAGQPRVDGSGQADEVSNFREEVRKRDDELWAKQEETTSLKDEVVSLKDEVLSLRKELNVRDHGLVGLEKSVRNATSPFRQDRASALWTWTHARISWTSPAQDTYWVRVCVFACTFARQRQSNPHSCVSMMHACTQRLASDCGVCASNSALCARLSRLSCIFPRSSWRQPLH